MVVMTRPGDGAGGHCPAGGLHVDRGVDADLIVFSIVT
jgi:hypothetical protein